MTPPRVLTTAAQFRTALTETVLALPAREDGRPPVVGLVPTMGALHEGHAALLDAAHATADVVIASLFVNPLQFDDPEDHRLYPRDMDGDLALLAAHGAQLVFAPSTEEMYPGHPDGPLVTVTAGDLGRRYEGAHRPGHFDGVATVVTKLFSIMAPPAPAALEAWFGRKDAEQVAVIARMVEDLSLPVRVRTVPVVRDEHGLAMSSRNRRLSDDDHASALSLSRTLTELRGRAAAGEPLDVDGLSAALHARDDVDLDYLVVADPRTLRPADLTDEGTLTGPALGLIAARVGGVRLIDNMDLEPLTRNEEHLP
ncbi:MAG: pantoate--beta-alanine ligase [Nesterenkonia sp.]|nr:pantoate--beta-alanine ligase [Nesterenkonia sp.]